MGTLTFKFPNTLFHGNRLSFLGKYFFELLPWQPAIPPGKTAPPLQSGEGARRLAYLLPSEASLYKKWCWQGQWLVVSQPSFPSIKPSPYEQAGAGGSGPESFQPTTGRAEFPPYRWEPGRGWEWPNSELLRPERKLQQHKLGVARGEEKPVTSSWEEGIALFWELDQRDHVFWLHTPGGEPASCGEPGDEGEKPELWLKHHRFSLFLSR